MAKIISIIRVIVKRHRERVTFENYRNLKGIYLMKFSYSNKNVSLYDLLLWCIYNYTKMWLREHRYHRKLQLSKLQIKLNVTDNNLCHLEVALWCILFSCVYHPLFITLLLYSIIALLHCQQTDHLSQLPLFLLISSWKAVLTASFVLMNKRIPYCRGEKNRVELYGIIIFN